MGEGEGEKTEGAQVGRVVGYYAKIGVAAVVAEGEFAVGDTLHFKGHTTDFETTLKSMQVDGKAVEAAKAGDEVGIKVPDRVREHDRVLKK